MNSLNWRNCLMIDRPISPTMRTKRSRVVRFLRERVATCNNLVTAFIPFDGTWNNSADPAWGHAAPLLGILSAWAGCTLTFALTEARLRRRITVRFCDYVDPVLVKYVLDQPHENRLPAVQREMTVVFMDIAGFTSAAESLKEKLGSIVAAYMDQIVPIIRAHRGYVNKFLGDGIMFFFGAPREDSAHAVRAVRTVLAIQECLARFNEARKARSEIIFDMRAGISTGEMTVGDAGSKCASDYTVLGDSVNLGSRLESANKQFGTRILMSERTAELTARACFSRVVGRIKVVGKNQAVTIFEPICRRSAMTAAHQALAASSSELFHRFRRGDFSGSLEILATDGPLFRDRRFVETYTRQCLAYLEAPPPANFSGEILLQNK